MFFYNKWIVSVKKKSYNVEEGVKIQWRCRNMGQVTMSDYILTLCPPLSQSLAPLVCKHHRFRKTIRWESLHRGFLRGEKPSVLIVLLLPTVLKSLWNQTCQKWCGGHWEGLWALRAGKAADAAGQFCLGWKLSASKGKHRAHGTWQS